MALRIDTTLRPHKRVANGRHTICRPTQSRGGHAMPRCAPLASAVRHGTRSQRGGREEARSSPLAQPLAAARRAQQERLQQLSVSGSSARGFGKVD